MFKKVSGKILLIALLILGASFIGIAPNLDQIFSTDNAVHAEKDNGDLMKEQPQKQLDSQFIAANQEFAFKLFSEILNKNDQKNVFISPTSISLALSLLYNGASGETQQEMQRALQFTGIDLEDINSQQKILQKLLQNQPESELSIANSLWIRQNFPIKSDFINSNQKYYQAKVEELDFDQPETLSIINNWVSDSTQGKIEKIIDQISPDDVLFLINAIYFKGAWQSPFDPEFTEEKPFTLASGEIIDRPLMVNGGYFAYLENDDLQMIGLPYGESGDLIMYVILPQKDSSLEHLSSQLNPENWRKWLGELRSQEGTIFLPKFTLEYEVVLNDILQSLGMEKAFNNQADFSSLTDEPVEVNQVKHKTFVDVSEEGTEAAAVTSIGVRVTSMPVDPPFEMMVNRPFFYAIYDQETENILFMGNVNEL